MGLFAVTCIQLSRKARLRGAVTLSAVWNCPTNSSMLKCSCAVTMSCAAAQAPHGGAASARRCVFTGQQGAWTSQAVEEHLHEGVQEGGGLVHGGIRVRHQPEQGIKCAVEVRLQEVVPRHLFRHPTQEAPASCLPTLHISMGCYMYSDSFGTCICWKSLQGMHARAAGAGTLAMLYRASQA